MYKIWTLERLDGSVAYFTRERYAIEARAGDLDSKVYKPTAVPKLGFSESSEYDFEDKKDNTEV